MSIGRVETLFNNDNDEKVLVIDIKRRNGVSPVSFRDITDSFFYAEFNHNCFSPVD